MRRGLRSGLLRLPRGVGYRIARVLHVRATATIPPTHQNGSGTAPLTVQLEGEGRSKRLRVRAPGDIWSEEFRKELAKDRRFEASLVWREFAILVFIAAVLAARTLAG